MVGASIQTCELPDSSMDGGFGITGGTKTGGQVEGVLRLHLLQLLRQDIGQQGEGQPLQGGGVTTTGGTFPILYPTLADSEVLGHDFMAEVIGPAKSTQKVP
jgi:hypothetical protein